MHRIQSFLTCGVVVVSLAFCVGTSFATVKLDGYLISEQACEAVQSIKKGTNPGHVTLTVGMAYHVIGQNKLEATHYLLRMPEASPQDRWVAVSCGKLLIDCRESEMGNDKPVPEKQNYVLALSWQPAFCQTHQSKVECETQTAERFDAVNLSLHGLWPQPQGNVYCNVNNQARRLDEAGAWSQLPSLGLSDATRDTLIVSMPGVASFLHRHEWTKHGTCYGNSPETYFRDSLRLIDQVNDSSVREFFASNIGQNVTGQEIRDAFDNAFGAGVGDRVRIVCHGGLITELQINLAGHIDANSDFETLLEKAPTTPMDCTRGKIDAAGF
jgi:ribonuclease T2